MDPGLRESQLYTSFQTSMIGTDSERDKSRDRTWPGLAQVMAELAHDHTLPATKMPPSSLYARRLPTYLP